MRKKAFMAALMIILVLVALGLQAIHVTEANPIGAYQPDNPHTIINVESPANLTKYDKYTRDITVVVSLNFSLWYPSYLLTWNPNYTCSLSSVELRMDNGKYRFNLLESNSDSNTPLNPQITSQTQIMQISTTLKDLSEGNHSLQVKTTTNGVHGYYGSIVSTPIYDQSGITYFVIGIPTITQPTPTPIATPTPMDPKIVIISALCQAGKASFNFTAKQLYSWIGYSLDRKDTVTITGNVTTIGWAGNYNHYCCIFDLTAGKHNVTFYAKADSGNLEQSNPLSFTINEQTPTPTPATTMETTIEPIQTATSTPTGDSSFTLDTSSAAIGITAVIALVAAVALVYLKRRKG